MSLQAREAAEAKQRHAAELRRQIEAAEAAAAQKRAAARSEGAAARASEAARQAMVEVNCPLSEACDCVISASPHAYRGHQELLLRIDAAHFQPEQEVWWSDDTMTISSKRLHLCPWGRTLLREDPWIKSAAMVAVCEQALRQKKLKELQEAGVPGKYCAELARKTFVDVHVR